MRTLTILFTLLFMQLFFAQNSFDYSRDWGTYNGGIGAFVADVGYNKFSTDSQGNLFTTFEFYGPTSYPESYYNQFVTSGGNPVDLNSYSNVYESIFSPSGNRIFGSFRQHSNDGFSSLVHIDSQDNRYALKYSTSTNLPGTSGVWFPSNPEPSNVQTLTLTKTSSSGVALWTTYLPVKEISGYINEKRVITDAAGNIYVICWTNIQQGITTSGVYQENFIVSNQYYTNVPDPNSYIVKLNPQGQKIWATYVPAAIHSPAFYNGSLYFLTDKPAPNISFATPGAFQQTPAKQSLVRMNADNGQLVWGTYFSASNNYDQSRDYAYTLKANVNGIFLYGIADHPNYYGTPGSHQPTKNGEYDVFLNKFDHNGNRIWGTYFGGPGHEYSSNSSMMDVKGNTIIITGISRTTTATVSNISTPGAFSTFHSTTGDALFFTKFDTNGNRIWTSYYGGYNLASNSHEDIGVLMKDENTFFIYGTTSSDQGIASTNAAQSQIYDPYYWYTTNFIAKFSKNGSLYTNENSVIKKTNLFPNPSNGNFNISGIEHENQQAVAEVYDFSGRLLIRETFKTQKQNSFHFSGKLKAGNYLLNIKNKNGEKIFNTKLIIK